MGLSPAAEASPRCRRGLSLIVEASPKSEKGQSPVAEASPRRRRGLSPIAEASPISKSNPAEASSKSKRHSSVANPKSKGQTPVAETLPNFMEQPPSGYMICYERFAEDVFSLLWSQFDVPRHVVPIPQRPPNNYRSARIVTAVMRAINLNQIICRKLLYNIFETASRVTERFLETSDDMHNFLNEVLFYVFDHAERDRTFNVSTRVVHSLTIPVELVLYLVSKDVGSYYIAEVPKFWSVFFTTQLSREFFSEGGFEALHEKCEMAAHVDAFLSYFIPKYCLSYTGEDLYQKYSALFYQGTNTSPSPTRGNSSVSKEADSRSKKEIDDSYLEGLAVSASPKKSGSKKKKGRRKS